jgi:hypothetical protein
MPIVYVLAALLTWPSRLEMSAGMAARSVPPLFGCADGLAAALAGAPTATLEEGLGAAALAAELPDTPADAPLEPTGAATLPDAAAVAGTPEPAGAAVPPQAASRAALDVPIRKRKAARRLKRASITGGRITPGGSRGRSIIPAR